MTSVQQIFTKIRQICQSCYEGLQNQIKIPRNYKNLSQPSSVHLQTKQIPQVIIKEYMTVLEYLEQYIHEMHECKQQYEYLEVALQKQQLQIRKHIGIQQQLRLYSESVKLQLEECEKEKLELLENSKQTIKAMKSKNQQLFEELTLLKKKLFQQEKHQDKHTKPSSHIKTKLKDKSLSHSPEPRDSSLRKIIKTEYIEREKHPFLNLNIRKELKYKNQPQKEKKHKHYKSSYVREDEVHNSETKKKLKGDQKYKGDEKDKQKKDKVKSSIQGKHFDLGTYLSKNELKKSPHKYFEKHSAKQHSSKLTQKHHKSSFQQKSQKHFSKPQTSQKQYQDQHRPDSVKQDRKSLSKQKSKSKQSKKRLKSKENAKLKMKDGKKTVQHNKSLFSVSSVEYRSGVKYNY